MNESIFACYDSLFGVGSIQVCTEGFQLTNAHCGSKQSSEIQHNAIQHTAEHDLQANALYFNGLTEVPVQQLKQQQSHPAVSGSTVAQNHQSVVGREEVNLIVAPSLSNVNNTATFSNPHNIPFVQIHTTDVQPQRSNYGNVFRRAVTNHAEIKSEPIKSEAADSSKDRVNATPTPPVRNTSCNSDERIATPSSPENEDLTRPADTTVSEPVSQLDSSGRGSMLDLDIGYHSVRKCTQCRFICFDDTHLEEHVINVHTSSSFNGSVNEAINRQMPCPGCSNVFFANKSLEIHLIEDHFATESDAKKFIEAVGSTVYGGSKLSAPLESNRVDKADEPPTQERKSRIYLKNVECLREPRREPLEMDGIHQNHIADGFYQTNSFNNLERHMDLSAILNSDFGDIGGQIHEEDKQHSDQANPTTGAATLLETRPKQKISIKSVDVLREPALLRRDYDMQNQFCNLPNNCNELTFDSFSSFQTPSNVGSNENDVLCPVSNADDNVNNGSTLEKPRRPKIYIKNVDILKEPIVLPSFAANATLGLQDTNSGLNYNFLAQSMQQAATNPDFLNSPSSLGVSNQVYDTDNMGQLAIGSSNLPEAFLYDNVTSGNNHLNNSSNGNGLLNEIGGVGMPDGFQGFGNNNGTVNTSFLTYPIISCTDIDSTSHVMSTTPIITEPTPPPASIFTMQGTEDTLCNSTETIPAPTPPKQKQKIFIKNVDILKEPQFQEQRERGTLHLRTVDELNLMNRNEVESLIAPNLENNNVNSGSSFAAHSEDHTQMPEEDDVSERNIFYEETPLKLHEYATQLVNGWSADDYDLGDDIDCIITDSIEPINNVQATLPPLSPIGANTSNLQKMIHDLETPQMSMISIRDIEELTGQQHPTQPPVNVVNNLTALEGNNTKNGHRLLSPLDSHALQHDGAGGRRALGILNIPEDEPQKPCVASTLSEDKEKTRSIKKQERAQNISSATIITSTVIPSSSAVPLSTMSTSFNFNLSVNVPPLTPVTNFPLNDKVTTRDTTTASKSVVAAPVAPSMPIPPLVPVSSLVPFTVSSSTFKSSQIPNASTSSLTSTTTTISNAAPAERGRIYVANNLMQAPPPKKDTNTSSAPKTANLSVTGGTSVRGRPFGSNRSDNSSKSRTETGEVVLKCSVRGCVFRFKKPDTLAYHKRCHDSNSSSSQAKLCPECKSTDFGNWNTLHTHLWRSHQIDMELYSCSQCPFKTPIYSRLVNTHTKIHSEERNYKCEQCGKAFKNTKQLKNHRRWHRTHGNVPASSADVAASSSGTNSNSDAKKTTSLTSADLHHCSNCGAAFSHLKTLREHNCKSSNNQLLCSVCGHIASSKSSLKLHMFTHENSKRLKCNSCAYSTSDHNAFRRHKMTHENTKMYICPHCSYKSIQSVTFQKHVLMKHPDSAPTLIHKCKLCSYSTVNHTLFALHQIRHKSLSSEASSNDPEQTNSSVQLVENKTAEAGISPDCILLTSSNKNPSNIANKKNNADDVTTVAVHQPTSKTTIKVKSDLLSTVEKPTSMKDCFNMSWNSVKPNSTASVSDHIGT